MSRKAAGRIARAFDAAAAYDDHARVQAMVAKSLGERIAALPLPPAPRVLEIGCGTGFLTRGLAAAGIGGDWLVTDIAPAMVERARAGLGERPGTRFAVLDAEHGTPPDAGRYDLVTSSLAMQWFADPAAALERIAAWLAPGGHAVLTTLAAGTFAEWRAAHDAAGEVPATPEWPDTAALQAMLPPGSPKVRIDRYRECHADGLAFLRGLKAIGAHRPLGIHVPLGPAALRRVMAAFVDAGAKVTYEVATLHFTRAP